MGHQEHTAWDRTIPGLFDDQVRAAPDAVAVTCAGDALTYAQLDDRADRIAGWLAGRGVGPEDVVACQLERGIDLVATLLGILKAGAAYLSIEPDAPPSRVDEVLAASRAAALVTGGEATRPDLPTLKLGTGPVDAAPPAARPEIHPDNLAYVAFTSGSTGTPKGVGVPHRAVARLVRGDSAEFGPGEVFLLLAPVSFDASTLEIWGALLNGGRLAVYPPGPVDAEDLAKVLAQEQVTTLWLTAGFFHRMVDHYVDALGGLRQLLAGGDVLDPARVNRLLEAHPGVRVINGYGPTENTTFSSCNTIPAPVRDGYVPIGRAIAGTDLYVVDADLRPVGRGGRGELCAGGAGLSRGYITDPAATAARFVPNPFSTEPGARMYRTGDMVDYVDEGVMHFLGRADRQVKIRGFRIEPAEIERALASVPQVKEAVLVTRSDGRDKYLVAYVLPSGADGAEPAQLVARIRRRLRELLPAYMIPSAFVPVEEFPLKRNGKIDASRLPPLERGVRDADSEYVAARSPTEQLVCDLWSEALMIDRVGVHDDFFELGGNSLLAMDLIGRMETVFGVDLPIRMLLMHPTVEEFGGAVDDLPGRG